MNVLHDEVCIPGSNTVGSLRMLALRYTNNKTVYKNVMECILIIYVLPEIELMQLI